MKNSTKGLLTGVVVGFVFAIIVGMLCDASCLESLVLLVTGAMVLVWGFLGAALGEVWGRKILRSVILAVIAAVFIVCLTSVEDLLG